MQERGTYRSEGSGQGTSGSHVKPSLFSVLTAAKGFTYGADINNIELYREVEFGRKIIVNIDFEDLVLRNGQDVRLRDGDVIWIPSKSNRFYEEHSINAVNQFLGTFSRARVAGSN